MNSVNTVSFEFEVKRLGASRSCWSEEYLRNAVESVLQETAASPSYPWLVACFARICLDQAHVAVQSRPAMTGPWWSSLAAEPQPWQPRERRFGSPCGHCRTGTNPIFQQCLACSEASTSLIGHLSASAYLYRFLRHFIKSRSKLVTWWHPGLCHLPAHCSLARQTKEGWTVSLRCMQRGWPAPNLARSWFPGILSAAALCQGQSRASRRRGL